MTPEFIIAGFAKNGTTYLDSLLRNHPQICMPARTTAFSFFDNDIIYQNGINWYFHLFSNCDLNKTIGQTSADCLFNPGSIERIKQHLPQIKIIVIVRNPIDSLYSLYWHQVKMGREFFSLEKAIQLEPKRILKSYYHFKMYSYVGRNRVYQMINKLSDFFTSKQILIIPFEILIKSELEVINKVCQFLDINKISSLENLNIEKIPKNPAKIPKFKSLVWLTYQLRKIGLDKIGQYVLNKTLIEERPPKISTETKLMLEEILSKDIDFHKNLLRQFSTTNL